MDIARAYILFGPPLHITARFWVMSPRVKAAPPEVGAWDATAEAQKTMPEAVGMAVHRSRDE